MKLRAMIMALSIVGSASVFGGCATSGFVQLSEASPSTPASQAIVLYASKDIGRPYRVLGYVFRTTEGHREGMNPEAPGVYVLQQDSEEVMELRRVAAQKGADAIVGVELFPTFTTFGQAIGVSIGGLAVKFETAEEASLPETHVTSSAPSAPVAPSGSSVVPSAASSALPPPVVASTAEPLPAPPPPPPSSSPAPDNQH